MQKFFVILLLATVGTSIGFSQGPPISAIAEISVITIGPSQEELYSAFGHSGIRVYDSARHIDAFFNYGVFDFNQPNFYLHFTQGNLKYNVDAYDYSPYLDYYVRHNRFVHEQILNLNSLQKQRVFDFLWWNIQPQNKNYLYDYFYNNCATKIRDVIKAALKKDVTFDSSFIKTNYTIRNLTDLYLQQQPWGDLGIDICLGLPMDKKANPFEYMFLPDYIESSFDHAMNKATGQPLVKRKIIGYEPPPRKIPFHWYHPWIVFGIFLTFASYLTWRNWQQKKLSRWFDVTLFMALGLLGILLLLLWTMTDHKAAANNFNLLWALPTHAIVAVALMVKKKTNWIRMYLLITTILSALLLGTWYFLPQALNVFLMPIVGVVLIRSLIGYSFSKS